MRVFQYTLLTVSMLFSINSYAWAVLMCNFSDVDAQFRYYPDAMLRFDENCGTTNMPIVPPSGNVQWSVAGVVTRGVMRMDAGSGVKLGPNCFPMVSDTSIVYFANARAVNTVIRVNVDSSVQCHITGHPGPDPSWCSDTKYLDSLWWKDHCDDST